MNIRRAADQDIPRLDELLYRVQGVHAAGRPDLFKAGGKKYNDGELAAIIRDDDRPVFVAVDEADRVLGYAFCICQTQEDNASVVGRKILYIDDLCIDEVCRGQHIGKALYEHVVETARAAGCYHVTLNVWQLNDAAMRFYEACGLAPLKTMMEFVL